MNRTSLIIVAYKRNNHLHNLLRGIDYGSFLPDEVIVVNVDQSVKIDRTFNFELREIPFRRKESLLPLAKARNIGAAEAKYNQLIFMDVDCVPAPDLVEKMSGYMAGHQGLLMAHPKYLLSPITKDFTEVELKNKCISHPVKPNHVRGVEPCLNYREFWSLCFGIEAGLYKEIGGFDEQFEGYGAEDIDFAFTAKNRAIPLYATDVEVYHQQHPVYTPPVNHFEDIVSNSNRFFQKWAVWPMKRQLRKFKEMQLIEWDEKQTGPIITNTWPDKNILDACRRESAAFG